MSAGEMFIAGRRPSTPGTNTQVLFNDKGVDGANANLTFDKANSVLSVNGSAVINTSGSPVVALTLRDAANPLLYFVVDNGKANASNARIYIANDIFYMSFMNSAAVAHDVFSAARDFTGDKATVLNVIIGNGLDKPNVIIQGNLTIQSVATDGRAALNVAGNVNVTSTLVVGGAATAALGTIEMNSTNPQIGWNVTTGAANTKRWNAYGGGNWTLRTLSDDGTSSNNAIDIARGANSVTSLKFGNANDNPSYTFLGTGTVNIGGTVDLIASGTSALLQGYTSSGATRLGYLDFIASPSGGSGGSETVLDNDGTNATDLLSLVAGGSRRLCIDGTGRIGANTLTPNTQFQIVSATDDALRLQARTVSSAMFQSWYNNDGTTRRGYFGFPSTTNQLELNNQLANIQLTAATTVNIAANVSITGNCYAANIQGINANVVVFHCSNYAFAGGV